MSGKPGAVFVWTPPVIERLAELISDGYTDLEIGHRMRRSRNAIKLARQRHLGIYAKNRSLFAEQRTGREVAALLGLGCSKTVTRWIAEGWLPARRGVKAGPNLKWIVRDDDLLAFLANPAHFQRWDPAKVRDADWREWAESVRAGVTYLTTGQVAERYAVGFKTVYQWIRKGELPAFRHANWRIRESDLAGFVAPCERPRAYRPRRRAS